MSWSKWIEEYPARIVLVEPDNSDVVFSDQVEAEWYRDYCETTEEIPFEVVQYEDKFYVIPIDLYEHSL
jgi:hypothetical protein